MLHSKRRSCFGIDPLFMSRPTTSSVRYGTCAVHHTLTSHPVAICSAKRSPFTSAAIPPHAAGCHADPLELVGFAADSPPGLPPPPPPPPGLCDDVATARWMLLSAERRRMSTDNSTSTFSAGRGCRTTLVGPPSSTLTCYSRRTTGTGPPSVTLTCQTSGSSSGSGGGVGGVMCRTDSAPLPLSDYDDEAAAAQVNQQQLVQLQSSVLSPAAAGAPGAMSRATRCERVQNDVEDCSQQKNVYPRSSSTTTTSIAVCRL